MMKRSVVLGAALLLAHTATVVAQDTEQTGALFSWNSTSPASLAARAPGRLVEAGIVRYNEAKARALARPEITAAADDPNLKTQIKVRFIQVLFQNLNAALLAFDNAIRLEAGLPAYVPTPITPSTSNSLL